MTAGRGGGRLVTEDLIFHRNPYDLLGLNGLLFPAIQIGALITLLLELGARVRRTIWKQQSSSLCEEFNIFFKILEEFPSTETLLPALVYNSIQHLLSNLTATKAQRNKSDILLHSQRIFRNNWAIEIAVC